MATKKMVIHAGVHQAGTASIQGFLSGADAGSGVFYPPFDAVSGEKTVNHQRLAWKLLESRMKSNELRDWVATLSQSDSATVVLSGQDFCRLRDLSFLEVFAKDFDVEVAIYIRRQDEWVNSWYNLNVRWPLDAKLCQCHPLAFLHYLDEFHWIRYYDVASLWAKHVGAGRVHVRVVERGQVEDPAADFCSLIGVKRSDPPRSFDNYLREESASAGLPADQLELLRHLGTLEYSSVVRAKIINAVRKVGGDVSSNVYPKEIRRLIVDRFAVQNRKLAVEFLGREDGVLFRDTEYPPSPRHRDNPDQRTVMEFIRRIIDEFSQGSSRA